MRENLPYFTHENNARNHAKMKALRARYGWTGYGQFWALNEIVAESAGARLDLTRPVIRSATACELGMTAEAFDEFLGFLSDDASCGLVEYQDGILTTDRTQENYSHIEAERVRKRGMGKTSAEKRQFSAEKATFSAEDVNKLNETKLKETKVNETSLYKYLQNRHRHYAIDICGYSDEQYRDANNWGQFGKNLWPAIKDNTERWVDCVLSAAYSDKWCNGPKGKFSVNAIFSPKVLSILGPEIDKRMAECDTTEAKASADKVADDKYRADCEAAMAEWTPERRKEYDDAIAEREALYRKLQGDKA